MWRAGDRVSVVNVSSWTRGGFHWVFGTIVRQGENQRVPRRTWWVLLDELQHMNLKIRVDEEGVFSETHGLAEDSAMRLSGDPYIRGESPPPEHCRCGKLIVWQKLPTIGVQKVPADYSECNCDSNESEDPRDHRRFCTGNSYTLVMKNCPNCHTTLAQEIR